MRMRYIAEHRHWPASSMVESAMQPRPVAAFLRWKRPVQGRETAQPCSGHKSLPRHTRWALYTVRSDEMCNPFRVEAHASHNFQPLGTHTIMQG